MPNQTLGSEPNQLASPGGPEAMRILVAEDDLGLRDVLVDGLQDQGYQVDAVERGDDAILQLKFHEYDVAVIDWRMPGAPGIDVVAWARRNAIDVQLSRLRAKLPAADRGPLRRRRRGSAPVERGSSGAGVQRDRDAPRVARPAPERAARQRLPVLSRGRHGPRLRDT